MRVNEPVNQIIVDAQLPSRLCEILNSIGLKAIHIDKLPNGDETSDSDIIRYADENNLIVATKDSDFYHSHIAHNRPKRLLLITTGNLRNRQLFDLFRNHATAIKDALHRSNFMELSNEGMVERENT